MTLNVRAGWDGVPPDNYQIALWYDTFHPNFDMGIRLVWLWTGRSASWERRQPMQVY